MKFYGRQSQRKLLRQMLARNEMQTVLIYGRRRVGKSELIKQVLREEKNTGIYYECKETTEKNNVDATFYVEVTETNIKLLTKGTGKPSTWDKTQTSGGVVKTFTMKTENANAQATVENTPGAALPATGGPGTLLMYGLGAVVAEITGYNILSKRRKKYLNGQKHKIMKKRWS